MCPPDLIIDLGGSCKVLLEGQLLRISFRDYFDGWLSAQLADWRQTAQNSEFFR